MPDVTTDPTPNRFTLDLDKYLDDESSKAIQAARDKIELTGRDIHAVRDLEFHLISPSAYESLKNAVEDALIDRYGTSAKGLSVPVDYFVNLPDNSRLKVNYNPSSRGFTLLFGWQF